MTGDLRTDAIRRNGGKHSFYAAAYLALDAIRGELAESWNWKENPLRLEVKLRKGVMFPEKKGVMAARELVADDVVFSFARMKGDGSNMKATNSDVKEVRKIDDHTVEIETFAPQPILPDVITTSYMMSKKWCEANQAVTPVDRRKGIENAASFRANGPCLLYTSPSPRAS